MQLDIDRDDDVLAIHHFCFNLRRARNRHAFFAVHSGLLARRSAKNVVVVELKTRDRLAFVVYHADQLAGDRAARVDALIGLLVVKAIDSQILHRFELLFICSLEQIDEIGILLDLLAVFRSIATAYLHQRAYEPIDLLRILQFMRMTEEIVSIDRGRKHHAIAIVDRSAARFDIYRNGTLRIAGMLDGMRVDDLHPH